MRRGFDVHGLLRNARERGCVLFPPPAQLYDGVRRMEGVDRGYDNNRVYAECHKRDVAPVIPLRKGRIQPAS